MALITSILTGGSNSHQTTSEEANGAATDFVSQGVVGTTTNTSGVAPATGAFAVNAQGTPDMTVAVSTGVAYVTATPSSQGSQKLRVKNTASANVTISANSSGSTKYDWLYLVISAANAANPNTAGDNVATLTTSRSSSATTDDGTPPTYGLLLAKITVSNGATTITNGNIADSRVQAGFGSTTTAIADALFDFVESGCVWTADSAGSTLAASMTSGYVWLAGKRLTVAAVTARAFTASKDTYVDLSDNGDGTAAFTYTAENNNAASTALPAGSLRLAIIVSGASSIAAAASINQGQRDRVLPIASSIPYAVTDSLGNLICPRDPTRRLLGYRQRVASFTTTANATDTQITGLSVPVNFLSDYAGRRVRVKFQNRGIQMNTGAPNAGSVRIWDGTVGSGTQLTDMAWYLAADNLDFQGVLPEAITEPSAGLHTYNASIIQGSANTKQVTAGSTDPAYVSVELL